MPPHSCRQVNDWRRTEPAAEAGTPERLMGRSWQSQSCSEAEVFPLEASRMQSPHWRSPFPGKTSVSCLRGPSIPAPGGTQSRDHGAEAGRLRGREKHPNVSRVSRTSEWWEVDSGKNRAGAQGIKARPSLLSSTVSIWEEETIRRWSRVLVNGL